MGLKENIKSRRLERNLTLSRRKKEKACLLKQYQTDLPC